MRGWGNLFISKNGNETVTNCNQLKLLVENWKVFNC